MNMNIVPSTFSKKVFDESFLTGKSPGEISSRLGLVQISDKISLSSIVEEVLNMGRKFSNKLWDPRNWK